VAKKREHIEADALRLPREERARLAEALISSLDEESEIEKAWSAEIKRRVEELRSGAVQSIPAEEVFAELDDLLGSR
jgi:putative addiction module component (TIGR02574 family)